MDGFLKQSTSTTRKIGPFLDKSDGVTEETGLTPGVEISKAGAAFASKNDATATTHGSEGWYTCVLDATDTNTLGTLILKAHDNTTHLPVWHTFIVLPANIYDSFVAGTDFMQVDAVQISSDTTTADNVQANIAYLDMAISDIPTAAENADANWDEVASGHLTSGTTGAYLTTLVSNGASPSFTVAAQNQQLTIFSGDDVVIPIDVYDTDGTTELELSGATALEFQIATTKSATASVTKTLGSGISVGLGADGVTQNRASVTLADTDTSSLTGYYIWELQITDASSNIYTVASGSIYIVEDLI